MAEVDWTKIRESSLDKMTVDALPPTLKLPALPHAVTQFVQQSGQDDVDTGELVRILETDAGLTLELLKHVNSAAVGLRHPAHNVQQAMTLLGRKKTRMFVITTGMQLAVKSRKSKLINQTCFWNAGLQKALFAKEVAALLKCDGDLAFAGALLQDYLLPVVTNDLFDHYLPFVERRKEFSNCMAEFEQQTFGFDHALAGACLAHRWHLPDDLVSCILFHHHGLKILVHPELGRSAAAAVAISALLPDQLRQNFNGLEQLLALQQKWPAFDVEALAAVVDEKHGDLGMGVRNDFPLLRRCKPIIKGDLQFSDGSLNTSVVS